MNDPRTVREALLAELIKDVDQLIERHERAAAAMESAATRLEAAARTIDASTQAAKASVGEHITRRVNEETAKGIQTAGQAIETVTAAAIGQVMHAAKAQHPGPAPAPLAPAAQPAAAWMPFAMGAITTAAIAAAVWFASR